MKILFYKAVAKLLSLLIKNDTLVVYDKHTNKDVVITSVYYYDTDIEIEIEYDNIKTNKK